MYIICYGKSPKALETGKKLIDDIGGRYVSGTELMTGSFVVSQGEINCAVVMILPLEAAIKAMEETASDKTRGLPVIAVSPEGRYAAILRRGNKPYDKGCDDVYAAIVKALGSFCFSSFEGKAGITSDLTNLVARYDMAVNDEEVFNRINAKIRAGEKVDIYTDLPIVFEDPAIDPMTYTLHTYPYELREDFIKQYKAAKRGISESAVFITCTYLGDEEDKNNLILVPKILSLGLEIKTKTDPGYCRPAIKKSLINHLLNPLAVAKIAAAYSARESEIVTGIAEELGSEVVSFESEKISKTKIPMEMTFSPEKKNDQATALALLGSQEGTILIRRASSAQGLVFSVAVSRSSIILP